MARKNTSNSEINKMVSELSDKLYMLEQKLLSEEEKKRKQMKEKQINQMSSYFDENDQKLKPPPSQVSIQSVRRGVHFDGVDHPAAIQLLQSKLQHLKQRCGELELEEDTVTKKIDELFKRLKELARLDQKDAILQQRNHDMLKEVQDGTCIIGLAGFSKYRQHPGNGGESMTAKIFYSSPHGYKLKLFLYPNGIFGEEGYLFVELAILNGDYDRLLPWPFRQKVTITILNQDVGNDWMTTFRRNEGYPNKPPFIMSRLVSLREVDEASGFIKDDTFKIKCEVEQEEEFLKCEEL